MKKRMTMALFTGALLATMLPGAVAAQDEADTADDGTISVLAVLTASEGTYDAGSEGLGTLTLEGVERATTRSTR